MPRDLKDELIDLMLAGNRQAAIHLVDEWAEIHGYERAVVEILEPALALFGEKWASADDVSLPQGFVAGKVAEDIMQKAAAARATVPLPGSLKGPIVIGNIEDDAHALGRKMVVTFLRIDGWAIHDLGNDVLAREFVDKAVEEDAPIVAASAMMYSTAMNIAKLRKEIDARGLAGRMLLAVGGAVFRQRPELVAEVGGDGTARNAIEAPQLMDRLLERALAHGAKP
jgi:methanogenic corrinoid protein MtbC1